MRAYSRHQSAYVESVPVPADRSRLLLGAVDARRSRKYLRQRIARSPDMRFAASHYLSALSRCGADISFARVWIVEGVYFSWRARSFATVGVALPPDGERCTTTGAVSYSESVTATPTGDVADGIDNCAATTSPSPRLR